MSDPQVAASVVHFLVLSSVLGHTCLFSLQQGAFISAVFKFIPRLARQQR